MAHVMKENVERTVAYRSLSSPPTEGNSDRFSLFFLHPHVSKHTKLPNAFKTRNVSSSVQMVLCNTVEFLRPSRAVTTGLQQLWIYPWYMISPLGRSVTFFAARTQTCDKNVQLGHSKKAEVHHFQGWRSSGVFIIQQDPSPNPDKWIPQTQPPVPWLKHWFLTET